MLLVRCGAFSSLDCRGSGREGAAHRHTRIPAHRHTGIRTPPEEHTSVS